MDADALERLIAEIGTLRESVEELYLVLDHAWRNRQEIYDLLEPETVEPEEFFDAPRHPRTRAFLGQLLDGRSARAAAGR